MKNEEYKMDIVRVRLVKERELTDDEVIRSPSDAVRVISRELKDYDREVVVAVNMKANGHVIDIVNLAFISMGTLTSSMVHPRETFKSAILSNASHILLAHNHPGAGEISNEDIAVTSQLAYAGRLLGIELVDHIVIMGGSGEAVSLREKGLFPDIPGDTPYRDLYAGSADTRMKGGDGYSL